MATRVTKIGNRLLVTQLYKRGRNKYAPAKGVYVPQGDDKALRAEIIKQCDAIRALLVPRSLK